MHERLKRTSDQFVRAVPEDPLNSRIGVGDPRVSIDSPYPFAGRFDDRAKFLLVVGQRAFGQPASSRYTWPRFAIQRVFPSAITMRNSLT